MKKNSIYPIITLFAVLVLVMTGCEETEWPNVSRVNRADYLGTWNASGFRSKITYIRTQDLVTKDYSARDTTVTDSVMMKFEFGIAKASGQMIEDSVRITTILTKNKVAQTPVIKTGTYTIGETEGGDYTGKAVYINVWEKTANLHTGFANPIAEPYTTYTVAKKTGGDMELWWVLYNNTAQSSIKYKVGLRK